MGCDEGMRRTRRGWERSDDRRKRQLRAERGMRARNAGAKNATACECMFGRENMHAYECNGEMCVQSKRTEQNERQTRRAAAYRCAKMCISEYACSNHVVHMCMHANIDGGHGWLSGLTQGGSIGLYVW